MTERPTLPPAECGCRQVYIVMVKHTRECSQEHRDAWLGGIDAWWEEEPDEHSSGD